MSPFVTDWLIGTLCVVGIVMSTMLIGAAIVDRLRARRTRRRVAQVVSIIRNRYGVD